MSLSIIVDSRVEVRVPRLDAAFCIAGGTKRRPGAFDGDDGGCQWHRGGTAMSLFHGLSIQPRVGREPLARFPAGRPITLQFSLWVHRPALGSQTCRGRCPGGCDRRGRSGTTRSVGSGGGVNPAMMRTHSRARGPTASPGNRRRSSMIADSSPSSVNTRRMAAAAASSTANM